MSVANDYPLREVERRDGDMIMKPCGHRIWRGFINRKRRRCTACPRRPDAKSKP